MCDYIFHVAASLLVQMTPIDFLHSFVPGILVVLTSVARAEAQVRVLITRGHGAAAHRSSKLGGLCAIAGLVYAYTVGADGWAHWASWINTACSVAAAFASGASVRRSAATDLRSGDQQQT